MSTRINLLPYREERRRAANRQFSMMSAVAAGIGLSVVLSAHGVTAGFILAQDLRNNTIVAENIKLDAKIEDIKRLKSEINQLKARKDVIEMLQVDRASAVHILDKMVRLTPEGVYLKTIKQQGMKVTVGGLAQSNELVAEMMAGLESSGELQKPQLIEIKAAQVGSRRLSEFSLSAELSRPQQDNGSGEGGAAKTPVGKAAASDPGVKSSAAANTLNVGKAGGSSLATAINAPLDAARSAAALSASTSAATADTIANATATPVSKASPTPAIATLATPASLPGKSSVQTPDLNKK